MDIYIISILQDPDVVAYLPQNIYRVEQAEAGISRNTFYHVTNITRI